MDHITLGSSPAQNRDKAKEYITTLRAMFMRETGKTTRCKDMAYTCSQTDKNMKEEWNEG